MQWTDKPGFPLTLPWPWLGDILAQAAFAAGHISSGGKWKGCFLGRAEELTAHRQWLKGLAKISTTSSSTRQRKKNPILICSTWASFAIASGVCVDLTGNTYGFGGSLGKAGATDPDALFCQSWIFQGLILGVTWNRCWCWCRLYHYQLQLRHRRGTLVMKLCFEFLQERKW